MKAGRAFGCLFWALLYCVLYLDLVSASEDDLLDFDFADAKEPEGMAPIDDWQVEADKQTEKKLEDNMLDFSVDLDEPQPEKQLPPFDWREKVLRTALAKALTDRVLRQKFAEVMPILRVLSSQQRLALSALISAQMNANQGHELRLDQVRMMFGDDKKLLLPIVYDLANLVRNSARKYIQLGNDLASAALRQTPLQKRRDELTEEESVQDDSVGTIDVSATQEQQQEQVEAEAEAEAESVPDQDQAASSLEDFFDGMQAEVLDPQMINEALSAGTPTVALPEPSGLRGKRVRRMANEFVHKLTRSVPVSVSEQQLLGGSAGRTIKLNTTAFQQPSSSGTSTTVGLPATSASTLPPSPLPMSTQSYEEIEDLAFAGLNGTELPLPASADERLYQLNGNSSSSAEEPLPSPEELIAGPRYRLNSSHKRPPGQKMPLIKRKRVQNAIFSRSRPKGSASSHNPVVAGHKKCERFTNNMCIRTDDYPLEQIMGSIRRHKNAMSALLAEFYDKPNNNLEFGDEFDDYIVNKKRREDEGSAGGMCQSIVRYARPQKAKAASGEWKFIVNTGQHTQTLRLEKCSNPGDSCSYLAQTYRSHCSQVYNYHRLLSWDKVRGLHVDIFKVPTCCSCQVDGYRQQFPPLSSIQAKDYTPVGYRPDNGNSNGYSTINEEDLEYNDESEEDDLGPSYSLYNTRDHNELSYLGSKKVRSKLPAPSSVGPYLSPPDDDDPFAIGGYKSQKGSSSSMSGGSSSSISSSSKKYYSQLSRRRPQHNEPRVDVDLDLSPSETQADQEVNVLAGEQPRVPIKRKRIHSSTTTHSATSTATSAVATGGAARVRLPVHLSIKPQSTAATSSLPARSGTAAAAPGIGAATHAHQAAAAPAAAASGQAASSNPAVGQGQRFQAAGKSRPRLYAPLATTPAAGTASTLPTTYVQQRQHQQQQSTALPQPPHVNSIFDNSNNNNINNNNNNNNHNGNNNGNNNSNGTRRINYSYHPIIDFFEKNRRAEAAAASPAADQEPDYDLQESRRVEKRYPAMLPAAVKLGVGMGVGMGIGMGGAMSAGMGMGMGVYQHAIPTTHERRMGFGPSGAGGAGRYGYANDNAWQPMVVDH